MRWISAIAVALCLVAGGAVRPARASHEPSAAQLSAAKALPAELAQRRISDAPPDRRSAPPPAALAPVAAPLAPPSLALCAGAPVATSSLVSCSRSPRSSRGPPG